MRQIKIAIDGPSSVGKSTTARQLAKKLDIVYVDTGAMYRAVGLKALRSGIGLKDEDALKEMLMHTTIDFFYQQGIQRVLLDGKDVEDAIRAPEISNAASDVSTLLAVRQEMGERQRQIAAKQPVVMDGRDIGTYVLPDAQYKFFLTARPEIRARRRYDELRAKNRCISYEEVYISMVRRDQQDTTRTTAPLRMAEDAILIDTGELDVPSVVQVMISYIEGV